MSESVTNQLSQDMESVFNSTVPVLLKGHISDWPAVRHSADIDSTARYLQNFWISQPVTAYIAEAAENGRFFYDESFTGFNFQAGSAPLPMVLQKIKEENQKTDGLSIYVGSTPVDRWLPGFRAANDVEIPVKDALVSFWLGNQTTVSAHYDFPDNLACVVAGKRTFTLFPPEQVKNLYVGPVDRTPSGQAISLVDFDNPDFEKFPRFREALAAAKTFEMEAGDALFIPSMWWHHVKAASDFNLLVNYWWVRTIPEIGSPAGALMHAMLTLRDLPQSQRDAWRALFDHYIFDADESVYDYIPEAGRGCLAPLDANEARKLRAELLNRLNQ
jgi:hypothetical protein